jgi:hypothetical protein
VNRTDEHSEKKRAIDEAGTKSWPAASAVCWVGEIEQSPVRSKAIKPLFVSNTCQSCSLFDTAPMVQEAKRRSVGLTSGSGRVNESR